MDQDNTFLGIPKLQNSCRIKSIFSDFIWRALTDFSNLWLWLWFFFLFFYFASICSSLRNTFSQWNWAEIISVGNESRVRVSARVWESTLAKTPANESTRVQLDSHKLSDVSHKLNIGESKDSCKDHPGESKWTLVALYEILPLESNFHINSRWQELILHSSL